MISNTEIPISILASLEEVISNFFDFFIMGKCDGLNENHLTVCPFEIASPPTQLIRPILAGLGQISWTSELAILKGQTI